MGKTGKVDSDYLTCALNYKSRKVIINKIINLIKKNKLEFDVIAFTGMSGALIAPEVCDKLNKGMILIRKNSDKCHSTRKTEGVTVFQRFIIIDDTIETGVTVKRILKAIYESKDKCVGIILYRNGPVRFLTLEYFMENYK